MQKRLRVSRSVAKHRSSEQWLPPKNAGRKHNTDSTMPWSFRGEKLRLPCKACLTNRVPAVDPTSTKRPTRSPTPWSSALRQPLICRRLRTTHRWASHDAPKPTAHHKTAHNRQLSMQKHQNSTSGAWCNAERATKHPR